MGLASVTEMSKMFYITFTNLQNGTSCNICQRLTRPDVDVIPVYVYWQAISGQN